MGIVEAVVCPFIWWRILTSRRRFEDLSVTAGPADLGGNPPVSPSRELGEAIEVAPLGRLRRPRHQVVALDGGGEFGRGAEEAARLAGGESGEPRRLEISGAAVGCLDQRDELVRQRRRQAEAQM